MSQGKRPTDEPASDDASAIDPGVEAEIERATGPYRGVLQPEVLDALRDELRTLLMTHPYARALRRRLQPPAEVDQSGGRPIGERVVEGDEVEPSRKKTGGAA